MHAKGGSPVAFIEYQDVGCAAHVMGQLQSSFLLSSDRGPIRIEYAKSKMAAAEVGFHLYLFLLHIVILKTWQKLIENVSHEVLQ